MLYKKIKEGIHTTVGETITCLGLEITKAVLEKINGEIRTRKGTKFTVTLHKETDDLSK